MLTLITSSYFPLYLRKYHLPYDQRVEESSIHIRQTEESVCKGSVSGSSTCMS